jgi:hypothetical protein
MRVLRAIVGAQPLLMQNRETNFAKRRAVGSQFIRDEHRRNKALASKQFSEEPHRHGLIALGLDQDLENLAFAVDGRATYTFGVQQLRPPFRRDANECKF